MVTCPRCTAEIKSAGACPSCAFDVPKEWFTSTRMSMAVTGARTVGKTVLIATMIHVLREFLETRHHTFLTPLADTGERFERYSRKLFEARQMLEPTPPAQQEPVQPLMWSFSLGGVSRCLSLVDAAGEDFERLDPSDASFAYLGDVDLVLSLIDPLKVHEIAALLGGSVSIPSHSGDDVEVLRSVLTARRDHAREGRQQHLGIVLSKFDELQRLRCVDAPPWQSIMSRPGAAMQRDPSLASSFDDFADYRLLQAELTSLLTLLHGGRLVSAAEQSGIGHRLFATSALGHRPTDRVNPAGISPYRVLDPVKALWSIHGVTG